MVSITQAVEDANQRKAAVLGEDSRLGYSGSQANDRALFSGFDIDYEELVEVSRRAGVYFVTASQSHEIALRPLFTGAWIDGLMIGLYLARQLSSPTPPADGTEPTIGGEGG